MACRLFGDKPLPESMLTQFTDAYVRHCELTKDILDTSFEQKCSQKLYTRKIFHRRQMCNDFSHGYNLVIVHFNIHSLISEKRVGLYMNLSSTILLRKVGYAVCTNRITSTWMNMPYLFWGMEVTGVLSRVTWTYDELKRDWYYLRRF